MYAAEVHTASKEQKAAMTELVRERAAPSSVLQIPKFSNHVIF